MARDVKSFDELQRLACGGNTSSTFATAMQSMGCFPLSVAPFSGMPGSKPVQNLQFTGCNPIHAGKQIPEMLCPTSRSRFSIKTNLSGYVFLNWGHHKDCESVSNKSFFD